MCTPYNLHLPHGGAQTIFPSNFPSHTLEQNVSGIPKYSNIFQNFKYFTFNIQCLSWSSSYCWLILFTSPLGSPPCPLIWVQRTQFNSCSLHCIAQKKQWIKHFLQSNVSLQNSLHPLLDSHVHPTIDHPTHAVMRLFKNNFNLFGHGFF